jgi:hypothetical protein
VLLGREFDPSCQQADYLGHYDVLKAGRWFAIRTLADEAHADEPQRSPNAGGCAVAIRASA